MKQNVNNDVTRDSLIDSRKAQNARIKVLPPQLSKFARFVRPGTGAGELNELWAGPFALTK